MIILPQEMQENESNIKRARICAWCNTCLDCNPTGLHHINCNCKEETKEIPTHGICEKDFKEFKKCAQPIKKMK